MALTKKLEKFPEMASSWQQLAESFYLGGEVILPKAMESLLRSTQKYMKPIIKKQCLKRARNLLPILQSSILHIHMRQKELKNKSDEKRFKLLFLMLLALLIDLYILLNLNDNKQLHLAIQALHIYTDTNPMHMVITLLYCNLIKKEYSRVCLPMLRHVFSLVSDRPLQPKDYLRCLFLLRLWNKCTTYKAEVTQLISRLKCSESQAPKLRIHLREIVISFMSSETMMSVYDPEWICNFFLYQKFPPGFPKELRKLLCEKDITTSSERHPSNNAGNVVGAHGGVATNDVEDHIVFKTLVPSEDMDQVSSEMEEVPGNENIPTNDLFFIDKEGDQNIILDQLAQETKVLLLGGGGQRGKIDEEKLCATKKQNLAGPVSLQKECNLIFGGDDSHKIEKRLKKKLAKHQRKDETSEQNNEAKSNKSQSVSKKGTAENEEKKKKKKKRKRVPCSDDDENSVKQAKVLIVSHTTAASKTQAMRLCSTSSEKELKKNASGTETLQSTSNVILEMAVDAKATGRAKKRKKNPSKDTAIESHLKSSEKKNADGTETQQSIETIALEASVETTAKVKGRKRKKKASKTATVHNGDGISKPCMEVPLTKIVKEEILSSSDGDLHSLAKRKIYEKEIAPNTKHSPVMEKFVEGSDKTQITDKTRNINKKVKRKNTKHTPIIVKICRPDIVSNAVSDEKRSGEIREYSTSTNEKLLPENREDYAKENLAASPPQHPNISTISSDTKVKNSPQKQIREILHTVASNIKEKCKEAKQKTKAESSGISDCGSKEQNFSPLTKVVSNEIGSNSNPLKEKGIDCSFSDDEEDSSFERKLDEITASFNSNKDLNELISRETSDKQAEETSILCNSNEHIQVASTDGISTTETSSCLTIKKSSNQNAKQCRSEDSNVCSGSKLSTSKLLPNLYVEKSSDEDIEDECESKNAGIDSASLCLCSDNKLGSSQTQQQQNDVTGDPEVDPSNSSPKFKIGESFSQSAHVENYGSKEIDNEEAYISQKASSANSLDESKEVAAALQIDSNHLSQEVKKQLGESIVLDTSEEEETSAKSNRAKDGTEGIMVSSPESIEISETQLLVEPVASVDDIQSIDEIKESAEGMEDKAIITKSSDVAIPTQTDCEQEVSSLHTQKDVPHQSDARIDKEPLSSTIASSQTMQGESREVVKSLETEETVHLLESKSQATSIRYPLGIEQSKPIVSTSTMKISSPRAKADSSVITRMCVVNLQDCLKDNDNLRENSENSKNLGGVQKSSPQKSSDRLIHSAGLSSNPTNEKPGCISFKPNELLSPVQLKYSNRMEDKTKVWKSNGLDFVSCGNSVSEASKSSEITTNFTSATNENPQRRCSLENIEEDDEDVFHTPETSDCESDAYENSPNLTEKSSAVESKDDEKESVIPPKGKHTDDCSMVGYSLKHMRLHSPASKSQDVLPSEECSCQKEPVAPRRSVRIRKLSSASEHSENEDEAKPKLRRKITVASRLKNIPEASPQLVKPDMSKKETVTSEDQVLPFDKALPGSAGYNLRVRKPLIAPSKLK